MHDTILRDTLAAMREAAREAVAARNGPENARQHRVAGDIAARRAEQLREEAARAFGELNGWRTNQSYEFPPSRLGSSHRHFENRGRGNWRDHAIYYKAPRRDGKLGWVNTAIVGQPYGLASDVREEIEQLVGAGYVLHVPPVGAYASMWFPGLTLFLVLTLPSIAVRWLPEQQTSVPQLTADETFARYMEDIAKLAKPQQRANAPQSPQKQATR